MTSGLRPQDLLIRFLPVVLAGLFAATAGAQEAAEAWRMQTPFGLLRIVHSVPERDDAKYQLWVAYRDHLDTFQDDAHYIAELQKRWSQKGVVVGVIMPPGPAAEVAKTKPIFRVLAPDKGDEQAISNIRDRNRGGTLLCEGEDSDVICTSQTLDGQHDALAHLLDDRTHASITKALRALFSVTAGVADGGQFGPQIATCLEFLPNSGRTHASNVLYHWWCKGDPQGARKAALVGIEALQDESLPLTIFADLVLRGDKVDLEVKRRIAAALAKHADTHKKNARFQLVYLRALLHAREDSRAAGRVAAMLPRLLKGRPLEQIHYAETLMEAESPAPYRMQAENALTKATNPSDPVLTRWIFCTRHKILVRCGEDEAAAKLMTEYRKHPVGKTDLNNDAWYLMVQTPSMGRWDTLAGAQGKKMEKDQGANISSNNRDTLALTYFVNGQHERALEIQKLAAKGGGNSAFMGRLKWYEATVARKAASQAPKKNGEGK